MRRMIAVRTLGVAVLLSVFAGAARANVIFDFSGTCDVHCSGTATGTLTLTNAYVFGTDMTAADFVSFSYTSDETNFDILAAQNPFLLGGLNADGSFNATGQLIVQSFAGLPIFSAVPGEFLATISSLHNEQDVGFTFQFKLVPQAGVPEPASLVLFGTALAGLGLMRRRKRR